MKKLRDFGKVNHSTKQIEKNLDCLTSVDVEKFQINRYWSTKTFSRFLWSKLKFVNINPATRVDGGNGIVIRPPRNIADLFAYKNTT